MKVLQFPLTKITIGFILGIFIAHYLKPLFIYSFVLLAIAILFLGYFYLKSKKNIKSISLLFGVTAIVVAIGCGITTMAIHNETFNSHHYIHKLTNSEKSHLSEMVIRDKLKSSLQSNRYVAQLITLDNKKSYGNVILNIHKDSLFSNIEIGTHIKALGSFYKNKSPLNPNQFDYGKYLENQNIYGQFYTNSEDIKTREIDTGLGYYASKLRNRIITNLDKNHFNKKELSVVIALILGQQQDVSQDVIRDYQYAGAIHILSVSGLHVGCLLLFITFLLRPISNTNSGKILKLVITLLFLWSFGILAGLAPAIVRSVTMFSFITIGMYLKRSVNFYHTLLVSMLLILLFKPNFLFDVGFQLSYIALFFIVWLQPVLSSIWQPKNKIVSYLWDIITVSFAAQIGTFPLSIYYFHQFPGLFFITNIIILPALSVILAIGVVVIIMAAFDMIWLPIMKLLEWCIYFLNKIISWVASFESFIFKDISFNSYMMWSCYLVIISLIIWTKKPTFKKLTISLLSLIFFQLFLIQAKYSSQETNEFIVFNKMKNTIITEKKGNKIKLYSNDSIITNPKIDMVIKSYLVANFSEIQEKKLLSNFYIFKNKKMMVLDSSCVYLENQKPDVLLLSQSPKINLERLFTHWKPTQVVVDASNYKSYVKVWEETCRKEKIPFHNTTEKGFYKL